MNDKPMLAFWEHLQFFVRYVNELQFMYAACVLLLKSINKWVERMVVRKGLSPLSWLMYEIVDSVGRVNFTFVGKNSGNFRNLRLWQPFLKSSSRWKLSKFICGYCDDTCHLCIEVYRITSPVGYWFTLPCLYTERYSKSEAFHTNALWDKP